MIDANAVPDHAGEVTTPRHRPCTGYGYRVDRPRSWCRSSVPLGMPRPVRSNAHLNPENLMNTNTLLIIIVLILLFGGGWGWSRRGR